MRFDLLKWTTMFIGALILALIVYKIFKFVKKRKAARAGKQKEADPSAEKAATPSVAEGVRVTLQVRQEEEDSGGFGQRIPNMMAAGPKTSAARPAGPKGPEAKVAAGPKGPEAKVAAGPKGPEAKVAAGPKGPEAKVAAGPKGPEAKVAAGPKGPEAKVAAAPATTKAVVRKPGFVLQTSSRQGPTAAQAEGEAVPQPEGEAVPQPEGEAVPQPEAHGKPTSEAKRAKGGRHLRSEARSVSPSEAKVSDMVIEDFLDSVQGGYPQPEE